MAERVNNYPDPWDNDIERFEGFKLFILQGNEEALKAVVIGKGVIPVAPNDDPHLPEGEGYYSESLAHFAAECGGNIRILTMLRDINPVSFDTLYKKDVKTVIDDANTLETTKLKLQEWYDTTYPRNN
jgi:hypothetical protein